MHAVIRKYSGQGSTELLDLLEKRKADIEATISAVPGFVSYTLARTAAGGISITVCQDQAGIEESTRRAKEWIAQNARGITAPAPEISAGRVIAQF